MTLPYPATLLESTIADKVMRKDMGFTIVTSGFEYPTGTGQFFERRPWREAGRIGKEAWTRSLKPLLDRLGHHYLSSARAVERVLVRTAKANRRARP
jgi:hypothetical protein